MDGPKRRKSNVVTSPEYQQRINSNAKRDGEGGAGNPHSGDQQPHHNQVYGQLHEMEKGSDIRPAGALKKTVGHKSNRTEKHTYSENSERDSTILSKSRAEPQMQN